MGKRKLGNTFITLGPDFEYKFAWCIRLVDGVECVVLHERKDGLSFYNDEDYLTAIPVERILNNAGKV